MVFFEPKRLLTQQFVSQALYNSHVCTSSCWRHKNEAVTLSPIKTYLKIGVAANEVGCYLFITIGLHLEKRQITNVVASLGLFCLQSSRSSVPWGQWRPVVWWSPLLSDPLAKHAHTSDVLCSQRLQWSHIENWLWSARPEKVQKWGNGPKNPLVSSRQSVSFLLIYGIIFCASLDFCKAWSSVNC